MIDYECKKTLLTRKKISGCDVLSDGIVFDEVVYGRAMKRAVDSQIENKNWHQNSSCIPRDYSGRTIWVRPEYLPRKNMRLPNAIT